MAEHDDPGESIQPLVRRLGKPPADWQREDLVRYCLEQRIRVDFRTPRRLDRVMNPFEEGAYPAAIARPTVEYRSPDGSAFGHLLLAAVTLAVEEGLRDPECLELARRLEVEGNVFSREQLAGSLRGLPVSAVAAAAELRRGRSFFEADSDL